MLRGAVWPQCRAGPFGMPMEESRRRWRGEEGKREGVKLTPSFVGRIHGSVMKDGGRAYE